MSLDENLSQNILRRLVHIIICSRSSSNMCYYFSVNLIVN